MTENCKFVIENADFELLLSTDGRTVKTRTETGF